MSSHRHSSINPPRVPSMVHVFYDLERGFFVSPTAEYLPVIPTHTIGLSSVYDGLKPRYAYDDLFYLAFVPKQVRYDLPMFECLDPLACRLERVETRHGTSYRLQERLIKQWTALEGITTHVQRKLLQRTSGTYLDTQAPPYPSSMGFWRVWQKRADALLAIRLARTAFTLRFAFISWLIMNETIKERTPWSDLASDPTDPIPLSVCNSFNSSWICNFDIPRIGAFVDIGGLTSPDTGRQWHNEIPSMIETGIPIWFSYHHEFRPLSYLDNISLHEFNRYLPNRHVVHVLKAITNHAFLIDNNRQREDQTAPGNNLVDSTESGDMYGYSSQGGHNSKPPTRAFVRRRNGKTSVYDFLPFSPDDPPTVLDEYSDTHDALEARLLQYRCRQARHDTYSTFIAREDETINRLIESETSAEREKRLLRESLHSSQPIPTDNGPTVYVWIADGEEHIRVRVHSEEIADLWARTTPEQRHYNSVRDEYDVLDETTSVDDTSRPDRDRARSASPIPRQPARPRSRSPRRTDNAKTGEDDERPLDTQSTQEPCSPILQASTNLEDMARDLFDNISSNTTSDETFDKVPVDSTLQILRTRYGYRMQNTSSWLPRTTEGREWVAGNKVGKVFRVLALWFAEDDSDKPAVDNLAPLADLAAFVKQGLYPPPELSDLSSESSSIENKDVYNTLTTSHYENGEQTTEASTKHPWYMLRSLNGTTLDTTSGCRLFVNMATNVLHLRRADFGDSADAILISLLKRGIRTRLLRPHTEVIQAQVHQERSRMLGERPLGIGIKPHGVEITQQDYAVYMRMRGEMLQGPAGRAAMLEGGIVWRLAVKYCTALETVKGPDIEDNSARYLLRTVTIGGQTCVESILSQQEQYVIVGVYRVLQPRDERRETRTTDIAAITSWWPTSEIWASSGYATGYWSRDAEDWFQRRLARIRKGEAKPLTSSEWRKKLRHTLTDSREFISGIEKLSTRKIQTT